MAASNPKEKSWLLGARPPAMIRAGAGKVFVTERDSMAGRFASEGVLQSADPLTAFPHYTRRPSFYAVRALARHELSAGLARTQPARGSLAAERMPRNAATAAAARTNPRDRSVAHTKQS